MKRTFLLSIVLLVAAVAMAGPITREQARQKAMQFLVNQGRPAPRSLSAARLKARNGTEVNQYYVFNVGQRQGFVIVSSDDRTEAILGWADEGELTGDDMPDNLRSWLQGYADQLQWLSEHPDAPSQQAPRRTATATRQPVAPMMTTKWNQNHPYNYYAPEYATGMKSAAGCVCTSTCQVMYHRAVANNIATTTSKYIPAYTETYTGGTVAHPATGAKPVRTFTWGKLRDTYTKSDDVTKDEGAEEVARLMEYVGAALKMNYGESSGAYDEAIPDVLKYYFGYDEDVVHINRSSYTYEDWINIIYKELTTNGPLVIGGSSTGGGHSFVCDGYQEEDYVHINWGWGGTSDGYFKLSVLYPSQQGIGGSTSQDGFSIDQDAIINIKRADDGVSTPAPTPTASTSTTLTATMQVASDGPYTVGQPVTIKATVNNTGSETYSGSITLRTSSQRLASQQVELAAGEPTTIALTFTPTTAGTLTLLLRKSNSGADLATLDITIAQGDGAGTLTISNVNVTTQTKGVDRAFTVNYGSTFRGTLTLTETAGKAYNGTVTVKLYEFTWSDSDANHEGKGSGPLISTQNHVVNIAANGSATIDVEYSGLSFDDRISYGIKVLQFDGTECKVLDGKYKSFHYYCIPGLIVYNADGTPETAAPSTEITAPDGALAVDLSDITGVTSVTPNDNPNTLYYINSTDSPAGLDDCNVVKNGTCAKLTLSDEHDFWAPKSFTATEAVYTRQFTNGADGSNGWTTIMLPFAVSQVKQGDKVIDWFHSATDTGKHFWVKKFSSEDGESVCFDFATTMEANTPYIIAVPSNTWGEAWNLTGKDITFTGTGVSITADASASTNGYHYKFAGETKKTDAGSVYQMNSDGDRFVASADDVAPFRAYFKPLGSMLGDLPAELSIGSEGNQPTAINQPTQRAVPSAADAWYTLDGRRVAQPTSGIYISNGKKVIIK